MVLSVRTEPGVQKEDREGKGWSHAGGCVRRVWRRKVQLCSRGEAGECFWKSEGISGFHSLMALKDQVFDCEAELLADNYLPEKW